MKRITFFLAIISIFYVYFPGALEVYASADSFGCISHVYYEDQQGNILCIADAYDSSSGTNNAVGDQSSPVNQPDGSGDWGYETGAINTSVNDGKNCNVYTMQGTDGGKVFPLYKYNLGAECVDNKDPITPLDRLDCTQNTTKYIDDPTHQRLDSVVNNPACVEIDVESQTKKSVDKIYICNAETQNICDDPAYLRASVDDRIATVHFWCDQTHGAPDNQGIPGACGDGNMENCGETPDPHVPYIISALPPVSYCCSQAGLDLTNGENIQITNGFHGQTYTFVQAHKAQNGNSCDITAYTGIAPKGVVNCSQQAYASTHTAECSCTYDPANKAANGNTYTAFGCIPSNLGGVVNIILSIAIGLGGLVALIMMMVGGYRIMTNPSGPDEIKEGQEYIVNAILGLLMIIFCVIILRIVGVDVLGLKELGNLLPH